MPMDWRTAYFQQAHSDYTVLLKMIKDESIPLCHCLHYLQMTTEKLAKGFNTPPGAGPHEKTQNAFLRFVVSGAERNLRLKAACGFTDTVQYRQYLISLRGLAQRIENLSPEGEDHPNPEYPWQQGIKILVPVSYPFRELSLRQQSLKMVDMLRFIDTCFGIVYV